MIELMKLIEKEGMHFSWYDPLVTPNPDFEFVDSQLQKLDKETQFDLVVIGAWHEHFEIEDQIRISSLLKDNGVLVDGRKYLDKHEIANLKTLGIRYIGVGR